VPALRAGSVGTRSAGEGQPPRRTSSSAHGRALPRSSPSCIMRSMRVTTPSRASRRSGTGSSFTIASQNASAIRRSLSHSRFHIARCGCGRAIRRIVDEQVAVTRARLLVRATAAVRAAVHTLVLHARSSASVSNRIAAYQGERLRRKLTTGTAPAGASASACAIHAHSCRRSCRLTSE